MSGALAAMAGNAAGIINPSLPSGTAPGSAGWELNNNGTYSISGEAGGDWVTPASAGVAAMWEVFVTVTAGDAFDTGTVDTWLALSSTRGWSHSSAKSTTFTARFRQGGTVYSTQPGLELVTT